MKLISVIFLLCSFNVFSKNIISETYSKIRYKQAVKNVDEFLSSPGNLKLCPGVKLSISCGDKICGKGENINNCPADCIKGEIRSYNHEVICDKVKTVFTPESESEFQEAVSESVRNGMRVRIVGNLHSASTQLCNKSVIISTKKLKKIYGLTSVSGEETVHAQAGVTIGELSEWLHEKNLSLGYTMIGYRGVTIAGVTATGGHGSSPRHNSVMSSLIKEMTIVDSKGERKVINEKNTSVDEWKAFKASLGMLGGITSMKLKVVPQFNLKVKVTNHDIEEITKEQNLEEFVSPCDWGQINWFPGSEKFLFSCAKKTSEAAEKGAENTLLMPDFPNFIIKPFKKVMQYGACFNKLNCMVERVRYWQMNWLSYFKKENKKGKLKPTHEAVGYSHKITSSAFTDKAQGFFQMDWEIAVPASKLQEALLAVNELVEKQKVCLPLIGVFIRFTRANEDTLLAHSVASGGFKKGELVAFIEMPVYLPSGFSKEKLKEHEAAYEEFARMLVMNFNGRAHWGKNRDWVFKEGIGRGSLNVNLNKFQNVLTKWDPTGVFSNQFGKNLGLKWSNYEDGDCTDHYSPVCDNEGERYQNKCQARKSGKLETGLCEARI